MPARPAVVPRQERHPQVHQAPGRWTRAGDVHHAIEGVGHTAALAAWAHQDQGKCLELGLAQEPIREEDQVAGPEHEEWHAEDELPCVGHPAPRQERHHIRIDKAAVAAELPGQDQILRDENQQEVLCTPRQEQHLRRQEGEAEAL